MTTATSINLVKGQKIDLTKTNPTVKKFKVGLGWDTNNATTGGDFDLDASVFMLGANGKLVSDSHFIFYNNLKCPNEGVIHTGDNRTGKGDGDDESIIVDTTKLGQDVDKLVFVATIYEAPARHQNFGQVKNAFIRICDADTNTEIMRYDLGEDFSTETAMTFGSIYRKDGELKFEAAGTGHAGGLDSYVAEYKA